MKAASFSSQARKPPRAIASAPSATAHHPDRWTMTFYVFKRETVPLYKGMRGLKMQPTIAAALSGATAYTKPPANHISTRCLSTSDKATSRLLRLISPVRSKAWPGPSKGGSPRILQSSGSVPLWVIWGPIKYRYRLPCIRRGSAARRAVLSTDRPLRSARSAPWDRSRWAYVCESSLFWALNARSVH